MISPRAVKITCLGNRRNSEKAFEKKYAPQTILLKSPPLQSVCYNLLLTAC